MGRYETWVHRMERLRDDIKIRKRTLVREVFDEEHVEALRRSAVVHNMSDGRF